MLDRLAGVVLVLSVLWGVWSSLGFLFNLGWDLGYSEQDALVDRIRGVERVFPWARWLLSAVLSFAVAYVVSAT